MHSIDTTPALIPDALVLPKAEWSFDHGRITSAPGTWCKPPEGAPKDFLALVCCPKCKGVCVISSRVHTVSFEGRVRVTGADLGRGTFICKYRAYPKDRPCDLNRDLYLDKYSIKPLYAVAIERILPNGRVNPEIWYCHATTEVEARQHIGAGHYRVVAVGPAIGYLADDRHGDRLSADTRTQAWEKRK